MFEQKPRRPVNTGRNENRKKVDRLEVGIYVKSRFRGNPRGEGEAAAVIEYIDGSGKSHIRKQKIRVEHDTRNALNLKICIAAVRILLKPCHITIYTECGYMGNAFRMGWVEKWQRDGWKRANKKPPANVEGWKQFFMLAQIHTVAFAGYDSRHDKKLEEILEGIRVR